MLTVRFTGFSEGSARVQRASNALGSLPYNIFSITFDRDSNCVTFAITFVLFVIDHLLSVYSDPDFALLILDDGLDCESDHCVL